MLRTLVLAVVAVVTLLAILAASVSHRAAPWITAGWAVVMLLCFIFERTQYKAELTQPPGPDWVASNELNVDANGTVRIWTNPRTGERAYVREPTR
jgi:hypothetical protein